MIAKTRSEPSGASLPKVLGSAFDTAYGYTQWNKHCENPFPTCPEPGTQDANEVAEMPCLPRNQGKVPAWATGRPPCSHKKRKRPARAEKCEHPAFPEPRFSTSHHPTPRFPFNPTTNNHPSFTKLHHNSPTLPSQQPQKCLLLRPPLATAVSSASRSTIASSSRLRLPASRALPR